MKPKTLCNIIAASLSTVGFALIIWRVGWWAGLGLFLALWAENISNAVRNRL